MHSLQPTHAADDATLAPSTQSTDNRTFSHDPILTSLLLHAPGGVGLIGPRDAWLDANSALAHLLGYPTVALRGQDVEELLFPEDRGLARRTLARLRSGERETMRVEQRLRHAGGSLIWADLTMKLGPRLDDAHVIIAHVNDVTERRRRQTASAFLSDAAQILSQTIDLDELLAMVPRLAVPHLGDWCIIDLDSRDLPARHTWHVAAARRDDEEVVRSVRGGIASRFSHPSSVFSQVLRTGQTRACFRIHADDLPDITPDPSERAFLQARAPVSLIVTPLTARGRVRGTLTFARSGGSSQCGRADRQIAEDFAASAALAIDNAMLHHSARRAEQARDDLLAFIGRDLRTPLSVAVTAARTPTSTAAVPESTIAPVLEATTTAMSLIDDLLEVSRIDQGALTIDAEPTRVDALAMDVANRFASTARSHGIAIHVDATTSSFANADPRRISQALARLIENGVRFTPAGGTITIRIREHSAGIVILVNDTGRGMTSDELAHLFNRSWHIAHQGCIAAGMGMALVKGIVDAHGGHVATESVLGVGTTITITLPYWRRSERRDVREPDDSPDPASVNAPTQASGKILAGADALTLSARERAVLSLAAQGFTAAQSAEHLSLSPKTIETYRARAMHKLGLTSRAELVRFAMDAGFLSAP